MYVFRLQKTDTVGALKSGTDWFDSDSYEDVAIQLIPDPEGGKGDEPTSIPSPFARIDLMNTAFKFVNEGENLDGDTTFHKIVSDCLDLAQILFNYDRWGDKIKLITWDTKNDLDLLLKSNNQGHKLLGEVLDLYLIQDESSFNFDKLSKIYLIQYDNEIIGGTSPLTLFFTTANKIKLVEITFPKGDKAFDVKYCPLYKRDEDFQLYLYALRKHIGEGKFPTYFRVFSTYLDKNLAKLNEKNKKLHDQILNLSSDYYTIKYDEIGNRVFILKEIPLLKQKSDDNGRELNSDFLINSEKYSGQKKPLVLINGHKGKTKAGKSMIYYDTTLFDENYKIPFKPKEEDFKKRELPGITGIKYPWLTVSDFLEPSIIKLIYPINKEKFFDGNLITNSKDNFGYILPLKKLYFNFFNVKNLSGFTSGGKKNLEIVQGATGGVTVTLRIPIKKVNEYITFERTYYPSQNEYELPNPDEENNKGVIIENQFGITIFPFIKTNDKSINAHYRIQLIDRDIKPINKANNYELNFYQDKNNTKIDYTAKTIRSNKERDDATSQFYILENEFDYIQVTHNWAKGLIIPKWGTYSKGNEAFTFAVDFGSTNTHIEYNTENEPNPKPFEITENDIISSLFDPKIETVTEAPQISDFIPIEFLPEKICKNFDCSFPQRTVISENNKLDFSKAIYSLADFNIPFIYEKKSINPNTTTINTYLKWSNYTLSDDIIRRVEAFFENLLLLIRNKVLLNRGNLDKTKLLWFYPSSMMEGRIDKLEKSWSDLFKKYINQINKPEKLSESIAPFYYFKQNDRISAIDKPVVSIDIGGVTCDIIIYEKNTPKFLTSFKFGTRAIFGDAFSEFGAAKTNGFINKYENKIRNLIESNKLSDLEKIFDSIRSKQLSQDIIDFFFSLENNKTIKDKNLTKNLSFSKMLENDDDLKIMFLTYYIAIIYHITKLMKAKGIRMPRYITFSGTGSKILNILTVNKNTLELLTKIVIEKIYAENYDEDGMNIIRDEEMPKEVTCKGGLMTPEIDVNIENIKTTLLGSDDYRFINKSLKYSDINDNILFSIEKEYKNFINFLFKINDDFSFEEKLNVTPKFEVYKKELNKDLMSYIKDGLETKYKELKNDKNKPIEETLFFYPLIGTLNNLAFKIYESENVK